MEEKQSVLIYQNADGNIKLDVQLQDDSVLTQGTQFRIWATNRIHEYIVKGFTMDDDRLKQDGARSWNSQS